MYMCLCRTAVTKVDQYYIPDRHPLSLPNRAITLNLDLPLDLSDLADRFQ